LYQLVSTTVARRFREDVWDADAVTLFIIISTVVAEAILDSPASVRLSPPFAFHLPLTKTKQLNNTMKLGLETRSPSMKHLLPFLLAISLILGECVEKFDSIWGELHVVACRSCSS
jgi:hypothetical protein